MSRAWHFCSVTLFAIMRRLQMNYTSYSTKSICPLFGLCADPPIHLSIQSLLSHPTHQFIHKSIPSADIQPASYFVAIHPSMLFSHRLFIHAMHFVPFSILDWLDVDFEMISTIDRLYDVTELRHSVNATSLISIEIHFIFLFISKSSC